MDKPNTQFNPDALNDVYGLFKKTGYNKSKEDFKKLIDTNPEALKDAYSLFKDSGYERSEEDFSSLVGVKKKEDSEVGYKDLEYNSEKESLDLSKKMTDQKVKDVESTHSEYKNFKEGSASWNQDKIKQSNPEITKLFDEFQMAKTVSDEKKEEIIQDVDDAINQSGWLNNIKAYGKKGLNALMNTVVSFSGVPKSEQSNLKEKFSLETNPIGEELKEVEKEHNKEVELAKKNNEPIPTLSEEEKISKARQLKIDKKIKSQSNSQELVFLKDAQKNIDAFGMSDKDKLKLYQYSELSSLSEKDKDILSKKDFLQITALNTLQEIKEVNQKYAEGEYDEVEKFSKISELYSKYDGNLKELQQVSLEFANSQNNIGSVKDNIDVLKRDYVKIKNFIENAGATGADLTAGIFNFQNWVEQSMGVDISYNQIMNRHRAMTFSEIAKETREDIAKPISVEDINTNADFGQWFWNTAVASQIPIYAAVSTGVGGIGALGASATGTQWKEMQEEEDAGEANYNYWQKTFVPLGYGASETVSAYVDRLVLMNSARIIKSATMPERKIIAQGMWQGVKNSSKEIAKNTLFEGTDEAATEVMQNLMDIYALDKKDVRVFDNVLDASAAGAIMGAMMPLGASIISKGIKPFNSDSKISKVNKEILQLEKALDNINLSQSERTIAESQLSKARLKNQTLLEEVIKDISSMSNEEFNAIKRIEKTQANLKEQAKEIQKGNLDQEMKDQIISNLKEEFNAVESERVGILNKDSNTLLNLLDSKEVIRLKDEAARELMQEKNPDGTKNITIEDNEISKRALENYRKESSQKDIDAPLSNELGYETAQAKDIVDDGNTRSSNEQLDTVQGDLENKEKGDDKTQEIQSSKTIERPKIIKTSDNGREYNVSNEEGRIVFKDRDGNTPSKRTSNRLALEYAKQTDLTEGNRAHEVEGVVDSSELANMTVKETNKFIAEKSESALEVAETILGNEIEDYRNGVDYKQKVIAENLGHVSRESFIQNSDEVHAKEGGSIPIQYLRKDGAPLDTKAKELSEIAGIEITEQDIVDFILENPTGAQVFLNNGYHADMSSLKARFEEITGLPATNEILNEVLNQNDNKNNRLENMSSLDFMSDNYFINLTNEIKQYEQEATNRSAKDFPKISDSKEDGRRSRVQEKSSERHRGSEEESSGSREAEGKRVTLPKSTFSKLVQTFQKFFGAGNVHSDSNKLAQVLGQDPNSVFFQKQWEGINDTFNSELEQLEKGTLPKGHIFKLGSPTRILQAAGIPNLPIELAASRLKNKSKQDNHPFELSEIKNLVIAVQNPLAVFDSSTQDGSFVVLTEIKKDNKNFIVAIEANKGLGKIEVNSVRSVYPRNNMQVVSAINDNLTRYADKQKMREWFSKQRFNSADVKGLFSRASNLLQKFENPKVNDTDLQVDYKKLASENKYTQPKVPTQNIFFNDVEVLNRETENVVGKLVDEGKNSFVQSIDVVNIIPTQKNVNINNLKEVQDVRERPLLFKQGDKYYVIDGHHRISNEILAGEKKVEADVYDIDTQFMQTPDGTIWGATYLNEQGQREIYINESALSPETLLHEVYHPFDDMMKQASENGDVHALVAIARLDNLAKENGYLSSVQSNPNYYKKTLEQQQAEARVQMIGKIGNKQLDKTFYEKLERAVIDAVKWLADKFGLSLKNYSPEQILNLKLEDIVNASLTSAHKGEFKGDNTNFNLSKDLKIDKFIENLDKAIDNLDQFGKENLGMNLPLVVARQALQAMKVAAKTAKSVADIISAGLNAVQQTEWYQNLSQKEKTDLDSNFIDYLNKPYETNRNSRNRTKIENEIKQALKEGKTEKEILASFDDRMEKMVAKDFFERQKEVDPIKAKKQVDDSFNKAEKKMEELTKPKFNLDKLFRGFVTKFFDRQFLPKFLLNKAGGRVVRDYIVTAKGAAGYAKYMFEQASDKIYKGLSSDQIKILDKVIQLKRFIAIDENRRANNLPAVVHPDYINENVSKTYLEGLKQELGEKVYNDLIKRSDVYFDTFRGLLNEMNESGIISKESLDRFFEIDYQPRQFLEFLQNSELETIHLDNGTTGGLGKNQIQKLEGGLDTALVTDSKYLLSRSLSVRAKTIAMNNTNRRLADFMKEQVEKVEELKKKEKPTKKEQDIIKYFSKLQTLIKENPIVGYTESGNPIYKQKSTPKGYANAYYWVDGIKQNMFMEQDFHDQYFDSLKRIFSSPDVKEKVAMASGVGLVKSIATGNNPTFFITNTPRDFLFISTFSEVYGKNLLMNMMKLTKDATLGIRDIRKENDSYKNFVKYGGMTDFLMDQGKFKNTQKVAETFEKIGIGNKGRERWNKVISAVTLQKMQVYSEIGFRMGVFRRSIANQLKELGVKNISEVQDKRIVDDIYTTAASSARNTMDFNQGGTLTKDLDAFIPYLNAAAQGTRVMFDNFRDRPIETTLRVTQAAAFVAPIPIGISLLLLGKGGKGDDEKDMSSIEMYNKAMKGVSKYDRSNYFIIFNGNRNANGEFEYYRIAKAQQLTPFFTMVEGVLQKAMRESVGDKESSNTISDLNWILQNNISPVEFAVTDNIARNPLVKSALSMSTGYDFFREQDISPDRGKVPVAAEGYGSKSVEDFYKKVGETSGWSPARMKAAVESIITTPSTSPYVGMIYGGMDAMFSDKDTEQIMQKFGKDMARSSVNRVVKETSEYNRRIGNKEKIKDAVEKIEIEKLKLKLNFNTLVADLKEGKITQKDINEEIKKLAEKEPFEAKRIKNRVKDQLRNKDTPSFVFEVKYANTAKEKAVLLADKFGDSLLNISTMEDREKRIIGLLKKNSAINK
ncbi:LPD38 domain-containing protein, partial [Myroides sp. LoEW2-1]|uniref:MuF-C-terminal domain-containing protein n=1 Tax=Myroides sp. LoEW2-1 TaxID=2683192 RepID=UPI001321698D